MSLKEKVLADLKASMKAQNAERLEAIRFFQAAIKNREIELRPETISDQDIVAVAKKLSAQLKDSIEQFTKGGRTELAAKESAQLLVIEEFLPKQMPKADLEKIIDQVIAESKASSIKDMGNVIKGTIAKTQGAADNKLISEIVKNRLNA
jgi:uncharacterized protein YqeY